VPTGQLYIFIYFFFERRKQMKNRRTTLIAFVLIAALCVGIGYAALTDTLTIGGTAEYGQNAVDQAVYFSNATVVGVTNINNSSAPAKDSTIEPVTGTSFAAKNVDELVIEVPADNLYDPGDSITFRATVKYDETLSADQAPNGVHVAFDSLVNGNTDYFDVTCVWDNFNGDFTKTAEKDLIITITLKDAAYSVTSANCTFTITYDVSVIA
jgi:hypothetical protein